MSLKSKLLPLAVLMALGAGEAAAMQAGHPAVARALDQIRSHGSAIGASVRDGFVARSTSVDADGTEHVRMNRTYQGLPVIGGDVVVHSRNGHFGSISASHRTTLNLSTQPKLDANAAIVVAGARFGSDFSGVPESTLAIYARGHGGARLAWKVRLQNAQSDMTYIVDARNGKVLEQWSNFETAAAAGTARTLYAGQVNLTTNSVVGGFELRDPTRGRGYTIDGSNSRTSGKIYKDADNAWGNGLSSDVATAAADAQYGAGVTWDYYKLIHGRNGIANDGKGAYSRVHYGFHYTNAFWSDGCFCMTYGDGDGSRLGPLVALDITGHEMSHGVTANSAGLIYAGESGGLNEANSDILGTMIEFYANNPSDPPDYMIGEKIFMANVAGSPGQKALRYMFHPSLDGTSPDCYYGGIGERDVHYSSAIANHFYYLLAEGSGPKVYNGVDHTSPTCNGASLAGIGRTRAEKIWYRALTVYFTSSTDYAAARVATIDAADDLYGTGSPEAAAVAAAWSAVGVN